MNICGFCTSVVQGFYAFCETLLRGCRKRANHTLDSHPREGGDPLPRALPSSRVLKRAQTPGYSDSPSFLRKSQGNAGAVAAQGSLFSDSLLGLPGEIKPQVRLKGSQYGFFRVQHPDCSHQVIKCIQPGVAMLHPVDLPKVRFQPPGR